MPDRLPIMNNDIRDSRIRISRRRALAVGGTVSLGGLLAACAGGSDTAVATSSATTSTATSAAASSSTGTVTPTITALLDQAPRCVMSQEETQGPYWFDVDSIRSDVREDRPGTRFDLAMRVQDLTNCSVDGTPAVVSNAVVEIWHCDAGGSYSGFESGSMAPGGAPGGGAPPSGAAPGGGQGSGSGSGPGGGQASGSGSGSGSGETSDGSYSVGDSESTTSDDGTYLRGAQTTDANGIALFTTIFPGWYAGRAVHIHVKVHIDKKTVLTTQLFFDKDTTAAIFATPPYSDHAGWESNTQNETDNIYDATGLVTMAQSDDGYLGAINFGIDA